MSFNIPIVEISLSIVGFGFMIMFCTAFCKVCQRFREDREEWRRNQESIPPPIYFIQYPGNLSRQHSEDFPRLPPYSQDYIRPPQYSTDFHSGPPPSYNECISPGTPSECPNVPVHPILPPQHTEIAQPHPQSPA